MQVFHRLQCRYVLAVLVFLGFFNIYTMRVNMSVAIIAMVKDSMSAENVTDSGTCSQEAGFNLTVKKEGEFDWNEYDQGNVLNSFFYSYLVVNVIGGRITEIYGAKWIFGIGILSTALLTLLTPVVARWNYVALIVLRVIEGGFEGLTFPAIHCLISRWFHKNERSFFCSLFISGTTFGAIVSMFLVGYLCESNFLGGWPSAFYVFGIIAIIWTIIWFLLMHEFPEDHPRISKEELDYISKGKEKTISKDSSVPWKEIVTSVPVWACAFSALARNWSFCIINYSIPTYLKNILHYDIAKSGLISSIPNIVEFILTIVAGCISDCLVSKGFMKTDRTRKMMNTIGLLPCAILLLVITFAGCNRLLIIICLVFSLGSIGICNAGYNTAIIDMSPTYASTLMGMINGFSQLSGILVPYTVGVLTNHNQTIRQWDKIFYISSGITFFALLIFALFGSATLQPWSQEQQENHEPQIVENNKYDTSIIE